MIIIKRNIPFLLFTITFLQIIKSYNMLNCDNNRSLPLEKNGICVEICTKDEINSGTCTIQNEIIKTQWLNNILYIGPSGYRYINIAVSENNNLYAVASGYPASNDRYIYYLDEEGNGFFSNENIKTPYKITTVKDSSKKGRYESSLFTFKLYSENDNRDYLISIAKADQNVEIFDFYNENSYANQIEKAFGELHDVFSYVVAHVKLASNNTNTYLIGLLSSLYPNGVTERNLLLKKVKFHSLDIGSTIPENTEVYVKSSYAKVVSCYQDSNTYIVCFFKNSENKYIMIVYSVDLVEQKQLSLADGDSNEQIFFKCVHFSGDIGAFVYFTLDSQPLLKFQFKRYSNNAISNAYTSVPYLILNNYYLNDYMTISDLTKVIDKKIYYTGTSVDKKILYIISILNYYGEKFMTRIYSLNIYNLQNKYIYILRLYRISYL